MITKTGAWIAETDYTNYPKDKMCFMDRIAQIILRKIKEYNYKVETTVTNICPADKRIMWYIFCYNGNLG